MVHLRQRIDYHPSAEEDVTRPIEIIVQRVWLPVLHWLSGRAEGLTEERTASSEEVDPDFIDAADPEFRYDLCWPTLDRS